MNYVKCCMDTDIPTNHVFIFAYKASVGECEITFFQFRVLRPLLVL